MKAGLNAVTLHILRPAEAVLVLLLCLTKIVVLHGMGANDLQTELLSIFRTWMTNPENPLKNNVLESKVADRACPNWRGAEACQECPSEAVQIWTEMHLASLSCLIMSRALFHLVPKDFTVLHISKVNDIWMQSGTKQEDFNTLVSAEGFLLFLDCSVWEREVGFNDVPKVIPQISYKMGSSHKRFPCGVTGLVCLLKNKRKPVLFAMKNLSQFVLNNLLWDLI